MNRRNTTSVVIIGMLVLGLSACGGSAPTPRSGTWLGETYFGKLSFTVSDDGKTITGGKLHFEGGASKGWTDIITLNIDEKGNFEMKAGGTNFKGQLSEDGTKATGYYEQTIPHHGKEAEEWEIEREEPEI